MPGPLGKGDFTNSVSTFIGIVVVINDCESRNTVKDELNRVSLGSLRYP
jgi:hypothetical protein